MAYPLLKISIIILFLLLTLHTIQTAHFMKYKEISTTYNGPHLSPQSIKILFIGLLLEKMRYDRFCLSFSKCIFRINNIETKTTWTTQSLIMTHAVDNNY